MKFFFAGVISCFIGCNAFNIIHSPIRSPSSCRTRLYSMSEDDAAKEAEKMKKKADELREQIRAMEEQMGPVRSNNNDLYIPKSDEEDEVVEGRSLKKKRILVVGANGRLGSMVTRYLLRSHPEVEEVLAAVHYVGEATSRGYGRLSYEVGAEDGVGNIGAAWSEEREATFTFSDEMKAYNLDKLRVVEVELLDPEQCRTILDGVDSVIWCATDFEGNRPRAIAALNVAFLFRAVASPTKGRVEIEGLQNVLGALKQSKQDRQRVKRMTATDPVDVSQSSSSLDGENDPVSFVLVSAAPEALGDFETPFGEFNGLKRQGENMLREDFPSLSHTVLQFGKFDDNFVEESLDINLDFEIHSEDDKTELMKRRINRRDAARAAVDALTNDEIVDKTVQVWTASRG